MKTFLVILLVPLLSFTCNKNSATSIESFSFGTSHCFCPTGCVKSFQIRNGQLFADKMDKCSDPQQYEPTPLPDSKYQLAKSLQDLPAYLLNSPGKTIGCPDCADQGSINIELKDKNGNTLSWRIDTNKSSQPAEIQEYIKQLLLVLEQL
jgi:hypothetical protein